jgi:hypothetical protein
MLTEKQVLENLDNTYSFGDYYQFVQLGHPYSYLIDCRLNVFKGGEDKWAIAVERLGFNPRGGEIELEIFYYGNGLINLDVYNNQATNYYSIRKTEPDSFFASTDGFSLNTDATHWTVNGEQMPLSLNKAEYAENGIKLQEFEPGQINVEEAARLIVINHRHLFRASEAELCRSIPPELEKILVLDEWHHKDFLEINFPITSDEHLKYVYEFNKGLGSNQYEIDFEIFEKLFREGENRNIASNKRNRNKKRPSSYETWRQIAQVIVSGDASLYQPTLKPNTHWENWPASGSL